LDRTIDHRQHLEPHLPCPIADRHGVRRKSSGRRAVGQPAHLYALSRRLLDGHAVQHRLEHGSAADNVVVGGGAVLQPVLYGMAVEEATGQRVEVSRLSYCTSAGGFSTHAVPISDRTREMGLEVLAVIDRAIESGFLAAAPNEEACGRCDF